jgi:hypothetical protein
VDDDDADGGDDDVTIFQLVMKHMTQGRAARKKPNTCWNVSRDLNN